MVLHRAKFGHDLVTMFRSIRIRFVKLLENSVEWGGGAEYEGGGTILRRTALQGTAVLGDSVILN